MFAGYCIFNSCHGYIKTHPVTSIAAGFAVPEVVLPFLLFHLVASVPKVNDCFHRNMRLDIII